MKILQYYLVKSQHSVQLIYQTKSWAWDLWLYTNTIIVLLIKLLALALVTVIIYISYITKYITNYIINNILILSISSCSKPLKTDSEQRLFYQMHTLIIDSCLPLFIFKMLISTNNCDFILTSNRRYASKSQNNTTIIKPSWKL